MVFWETTQACDLVCRHCRADARPERHAGELTTDEGRRLLDEIRAMGRPLVVLTGGDPAKRPDLVALVRHATELGLRVALTPSATPLVTRGLLARLAEAGLARLAVSLDGADAATHDGFRGVPGSFARTFEILRDARAVGLGTQATRMMISSKFLNVVGSPSPEKAMSLSLRRTSGTSENPGSLQRSPWHADLSSASNSAINWSSSTNLVSASLRRSTWQ